MYQNTDNNISSDALFRYATMGIMVTNEHGKIILANPFLLAQFGYTEEELIGERIEKLIPMRYQERHLRHRQNFYEHPHSRSMGIGLDLSALRKDNTEFPVEVSLGTYQTDAGKFVIGFVNDISYRKDAEDKLRQLNAELEQKVQERTQSLTETVNKLGRQIEETEIKDIELRRVNNYLTNIWNHAGAIIIVTDKDGIIKIFNPTAEKLTGYTADEVISKHALHLFHDEEELAERAVAFSELVPEKVTPGLDTLFIKARHNLINEHEWDYVRKDGRRFPVSLSITAIRNSHFEIEGYLGVAMDISERKKAETDLRMALEKEKELSELKSRFVSLASHEFRTPLSTVLSSAYLISRYEHVADQPKREKHIQRIVSSVNMLTDILNDFLSVGKIEEGKVNIKNISFDPAELIQSTISELQSLVKDAQQLTYTHSGCDFVVLDPALLKHIVINLLSNAIKFSPEGAAIQVSTHTADDLFVLKVKDNGIGIPQEDQQHLFERFFRATNAGNVQGSGLGLHIVARYAELMGGTITCTSTYGAGSLFTVSFPLTNLS